MRVSARMALIWPLPSRICGLVRHAATHVSVDFRGRLHRDGRPRARQFFAAADVKALHLAFAFQDLRLGAEAEIELYYVLYGPLNTGATYEPIPMPEGFFTNPQDAPQFALRPAK